MGLFHASDDHDREDRARLSVGVRGRRPCFVVICDAYGRECVRDHGNGCVRGYLAL